MTVTLFWTSSGSDQRLFAACQTVNQLWNYRKKMPFLICLTHDRTIKTRRLFSWLWFMLLIICCFGLHLLVCQAYLDALFTFTDSKQKLLHTAENFAAHGRIAIELRFNLSLVLHNAFCLRSFVVLQGAFPQAYSYHPICHRVMDSLKFACQGSQVMRTWHQRNHLLSCYLSSYLGMVLLNGLLLHLLVGYLIDLSYLPLAWLPAWLETGYAHTYLPFYYYYDRMSTSVLYFRK